MSYYCVGETVKTCSHGRVHCFPYLPEDPTGPTRTDKQMREHAQKAYTEHSPASFSVFERPHLCACKYNLYID